MTTDGLKWIVCILYDGSLQMNRSSSFVENCLVNLNFFYIKIKPSDKKQILD